MDKTRESITNGCHDSVSLFNCPHTAVEQSTTTPRDCVRAADMIKSNRHLLLVVRECVTSFTPTRLLEDERHQSLRDALIRLCIELRPLDAPSAVIRTEPAPWFNALANHALPRSRRLSIEIGRVKNNNKNPVDEKAVQKLENELLRRNPLHW